MNTHIFPFLLSSAFLAGTMVAPSQEKPKAVSEECQEVLEEPEETLEKGPQVLQPVGQDEQWMKESLSAISWLDAHDFVWLHIPDSVCDGGIKLWSIDGKNIMKVNKPVYFPYALRYFAPYGGEIIPLNTIDPALLREWKSMDCHRVPLEDDLISVIKSLYKELCHHYGKIPPPSLPPTWTMCAACNPQYSKEMMGQDVLVVAGNLDGNLHGFCSGIRNDTVVQAWQSLCLLIHDLASFEILGRDEQLWLAMQGECLLELIKQCPELEKSKNGEKPFNMATLTLPDSMENKNVWSLLFPTGEGDLCVAMVDRRSDREKSG